MSPSFESFEAKAQARPQKPSLLMNGLFLLGLVLFFGTSEIMGVQAAGMMDFLDVRKFAWPVLCGIAAAGGAVGGFLICLGGPERGWRSAVIGGVTGPCIFLATYAYVTWREGDIWEEEILVPFLLGAIPGYLAYKGLALLAPTGIPAIPVRNQFKASAAPEQHG